MSISPTIFQFLSGAPAAPAELAPAAAATPASSADANPAPEAVPAERDVAVRPSTSTPSPETVLGRRARGDELLEGAAIENEVAEGQKRARQAFASALGTAQPAAPVGESEAPAAPEVSLPGSPQAAPSTPCTFPPAGTAPVTPPSRPCPSPTSPEMLRLSGSPGRPAAAAAGPAAPPAPALPRSATIQPRVFLRAKRTL